MQKTLTLNILADIIAERAGCSPDKAEKALVCYVAILTERLSTSGHASIEGIGEFCVSGIGGNHILFRPDHVLARKLNEPFEMFEPIELDSDFPVELLEGSAADATRTDNCQIPETKGHEPDSNMSGNETSECGNMPETASAPQIQEQDESVAACTDEDSGDQKLPSGNPEPPEATGPDTALPTPHRPWRGIWLAAGFIAGLGAGFLLHDPVSHVLKGESNKETTSSEIIESSDPQPETPVTDTLSRTDTVPLSCQDPAVTQKKLVETVRVGYDITHMAKKHYGNRLLWTYIYDANPSLPANPNHIQPGTEVEIPDLEASGIDPASAETLAYARKRASEIYGSL